MTYKWNPLKSIFRLPNPLVPIKFDPIDGHPIIEFKDILKAWDKADILFSDYETKFFEDCYNKGAKEQKKIFKTTLELLYADRKEINHRAAYHRGPAGKRLIGWGRG